ncbi:MAG: PDZ domain-containing protein, partial [Gemmataceae bacterium]|nr:PDZ domain-containing protein [Gemmataceae bacterium]
SHLGFTPTAAGVLFGRRGPGAEEPAGRGWTPTTAHLGVRFADRFDGPGLKVRDVLPGGPADRVASKLRPNEVVTKIDGRPVTPKTDLTTVLNGPAARDVAVEVKGEGDATRTVVIRPIAPAAARTLLYDAWLRDNRAAVDKLSGGTLGYLHISAMSAPSFYKFEEALYDAGAGKDGLVIDVRENGGGSTADWLLTALTQPKHAIAVPRGGGPGYPQDRTVFATWTKPIVVLCNQNSFSNAEIFSHAVKTLKRGKLVGVPTAGGVVSTGATTVMDVGVLRLPFRGWYLVNDGEDMELHGAVPDVVVWPEPGDHAAGKDRQLEAAVKVLAADVDAEKKKPQPALKKATERGK